MEYILIVLLARATPGFSIEFSSKETCLAAKQVVVEYPYETKYHDITTLKPYFAECMPKGN